MDGWRNQRQPIGCKRRMVGWMGEWVYERAVGNWLRERSKGWMGGWLGVWIDRNIDIRVAS